MDLPIKIYIGIMRFLAFIFLLLLSAPFYAQNLPRVLTKNITQQQLKQTLKQKATATQNFVTSFQKRASFPKTGQRNAPSNGVWQELWKDPPHRLEEQEHPLDHNPFSDFNITLRQIEALKEQYNVYHSEKSLYHMLEHSYHPSSFAHHNNKMVLRALINHIKRIQWLNQYPNKGRNALKQDKGENPILQLATHLQQEKMIFLGEYHFNPEIQQFVSGLILALKAQQPKRRIVVFTEFLPLSPRKLPDGQTLETYYRRINPKDMAPISWMDVSSYTYAQNTFNELLKNRVEIFPLEDKQHVQLMSQEYNSEQYELPLSVSIRNKTWARIIENKMAQIRQTDPDALFVVYAGLGHVSWIYPYALPKFFAKENPAVVSVILKEHLKLNFLTNIWGPKDPFFKFPKTNTVFYWAGPDARRLATNTGFDYMVSLCKNNWQRFKQFFNELAAMLD